MPAGELPLEVERFCLIGRILERCTGSGRHKQTGVARYHIVKYGAGRQHDSLPVFYGSGSGVEDGKGKGKAQRVPMDTDFEFAVFWEGQEEPEMMSLEEVQQVASDRFVDEPWLPPSIQTLIQDGWDGKWSSLSMDNMRAFLDAVKKDHEALQRKEHAAAKRQQTAAQRKGPAVKKAPAARGAKGKAAAIKEDAPLMAADGVAAALEAKKAARKRKAMEALAAAAAAGTPRKRVTLPGRSARPPAVPAGAEARGTPAAAAAATMEPSSGHASPGGCTQSEKPAAGARKQRQQAQQEGAQQRQQVVSSSSLEPDQQQQQQQRGSGSTAAGAAGKTSTGSKSRQTLLTPVKGRQAAPSNGKAAAATATAAAAPRSASKAGESPAKSGRQRSTGSAQDVPEVLRQHELEAVAPEDSAFLLHEEGQFETVSCSNGGEPKVYWYDRVRSSDGIVYRVYSQTLIVPDALCFRVKADRRLRTWKRRATEGGDYVVEAVLAEGEDDEGDLRFLVKWQGYEADPDDDGWLYENEMTQCNKLLKEWKRKGRAQWEAARKQLLEEAGLA